MALAAFTATSCGHSPAATGFHLYVANVSEPCMDDRHNKVPLIIVAIAIGAHKARINEEAPIDVARLRQGLYQILQYRAEKVIWVYAEPGVSYVDVMEVIDQSVPETPELSILTERVLALASKNGGCFGVSRSLMLPASRPPDPPLPNAPK